jgi:hypothetical protein
MKNNSTLLYYFTILENIEYFRGIGANGRRLEEGRCGSVLEVFGVPKKGRVSIGRTRPLALLWADRVNDFRLRQ